MKIAICFVGFLAFLTSAHALNCSSGYEIQSEIFTDTYWKSEICPESGDPQMCLRSEGEIIIFGAYNVNVTTGSCVSQSTCEQECQTLVKSTLIAGFARAAVVDPDIITYQLVNCRKACCKGQNCNENKVEQIEEMIEAITVMTTNLTPRASSNPPTTTVATTTTTEPTPLIGGDSSLTCSEGFSVASQFLFTESWNVTRCRGDMGQKCIRGEGLVVISDLVEVNVTTTFCANQSTCDESCMGLFQSVLANLDSDTLDLRVASCLSECCDTNMCNNLTVEQIPEQNSTKATSSSSTVATIIASLKPTISTTPAVIGTASPNTLNCISGYSVGSNVLNESSWNLIGCAQTSNQRCIRTEVEAILFNSVNVTLVTGSCVNASVCQLTCNELTRTIFFSDEQSTDTIQNLNLGSDEFFLSKCNHICCENNNCNNRTIKEIEEKPVPTMIPIPGSPSPETPALECYSGYIADSDISHDRSWRSVQCSSRASQRCIRAEATAVLFELVDVTAVVGFCVDVSECDDRVCTNFVDFFRSGGESVFNGVPFSDSDFVVSSCKSICCTGKNCNGNSIPRTTPLPPPKRPTELLPILPPSLPKPKDPKDRESSCVQQTTSCPQDENTLFLMSLLPRLNSLPKKIASEVKMRILELFHKAEFGDLAIRK